MNGRGSGHNGHATDAEPPVFAVWLLSACAPIGLREALLGDTEERFHSINALNGARVARRWYWRQTLGIARLLAARVMRHPRIDNGGNPQPAPRASGDGTFALLTSDLRFAWRMLLRRPAFTFIAVFTLALGIGASTAIYSVVHPILIQSLPYPDADRIMAIWEGSNPADKSNLGYETYFDLARQNRSFSSMAAMAHASGSLTGRSEPLFLIGQRVTPSFFNVIGVSPEIGRAFSNEHNLRSAQRVIVLSHALWRTRFAGDSAIIGKRVTLDANSFIVLGVMPAGFENVLSPGAQFYLPLRYSVGEPQACRGCRHLRVIGRRMPGVTAQQSATDLNTISHNLVRDFPKDYASPGFLVPELQRDTVADVRPALLAVMGAVALVLLGACLNVMNLLLARGAQREREFAVRAALGATRSRIFRQVLSESALLALLGGAGGIVVAVAGVKGLVALSPQELPRLSAVKIDATVLGFALVVTTLVGIVFGAWPAAHAARQNVHNTIRRNTPRLTSRTFATRGVLVVSEVAMAIVLLVGSGLLLRSMHKLFDVNPGFDTGNVLTMQIQAGAGGLRSDTLIAEFQRQALAMARAQPGVVSAALTSQLPLSDDYDLYGVHFETQPRFTPEEDRGAFRYGVSDQYFETMKIPLQDGRLFTGADGANGSLVVIINRTFARARFGDASVIGQRVKVGGMDGPWREIVGVVGDVKQESLSSTQVSAVYVPEAQWQFVDNAMTLVVRSNGAPENLAGPLRQAVWSVNRDQPIVRVSTANQLMRDRSAQRRFALVLFEAFAVVALVMAAAGIYGVLSGTVAERGRELGVRAALGASSRNQIAIVLLQGMMMTGIGVTVGLAAAFGASHMLESLLYNVSPVDPATYASVAAALGAVAILACWIPARRASRISPMEALRSE